MQFIENIRSRSFLIEYFRHFFIDMSIFGHHGGPPLEGEGKAASSRRTPKEKPHAHKTSMGHPERQRPRTSLSLSLWKKHAWLRQARPDPLFLRASHSRALQKKSPTLTKRAWGTRKGVASKKQIPHSVRRDGDRVRDDNVRQGRHGRSGSTKGNGAGETQRACAGNPRVRE